MARGSGSAQQGAVVTRRSIDYVPYTVGDPLHYDVPWASERPGDEPVAPTAQQAPPGWSVHERGPWTGFRAPGAMPAAGWKVHVSTLPEQARRIAGIAVRIAWAHGVSVKVLRSRALVQVSQHKYAPLTSSGKVVTAYPVDDAAVVRLVTALAEGLSGEIGPGIPGELAIAGAPVFLRHGAFTSTWLVSESGTLVPGVLVPGQDGARDAVVRPDRRGPGAAGEHEPPAALRPLLAGPGSERLEVTGVSLVQRTNAGGVYRATWCDGRPVVLKEARRYAGLDAGGADATQRLRHERDVLLRLADTGVVPQLRDYRTVGDSEFLVLERIEGTTLAEALGARHPGLNPEVTAEAARAYPRWVQQTISRLVDIARLLSEHGVAHGDLHPSNVLETADGLVLIDFESASLDGRRVATGIAATGFGTGGPVGLSEDLAGIDRLRLTLLNSAAQLLDWRPELRERIEASGLADLHAALEAPAAESLPRDASGSFTGSSTTQLTEQLVAGIVACATPHRRDRLFPGDIASFGRPAGGLGVLHGAAGVLLALHAAGQPVPQAWVDWLVVRARESSDPTGGFAHGPAGVAFALARLGHADEAGALARRALADEADAGHGMRGSGGVQGSPGAPWWELGSAGLSVAYAELGLALALPEALAAAGGHARRCLRLLDEIGSTVVSGGVPGVTADAGPGPVHPVDPAVATAAAAETRFGHAPGLLRGWSGVGLALLRLLDLADVAGPGMLGADLGRARLVAAAARAVRLDARHTRVDRGVLTARHGRRLLPYLGVGSAAVGLAAQAVLERAQPGELTEAESHHFAHLVAGAAGAARMPQVVGAGLLAGRSGILAVSRRLSGPAGAPGGHPGGARHTAMHVERLGWHAVTVPQAPTTGHVPARVLTGEFNLRLSCDLATGSAGALVALAAGDPLCAVLALPRTSSPGSGRP